MVGAVIASFALSAFDAARASADGTVTVSVQGRGDATGDGITCSEPGGPGTDCSQFYADTVEQVCDPELKPPCHNEFHPPTVEVTAADRAGTGFTFQSWTGCDSTSGTGGRVCTLTVVDNTTITPSFRDAQAPSVTGLTPSGGIRSGTITLAATASDNAGVSQVQFSVRGSTVGTDTSAPYETSFNTASVADGPATLRATASDAAGNSSFVETSITIDNSPPTLTINSGPADGAVFEPGSTQTWTFAASDAHSGIASLACSVVTASASPSFGACSGGSSHTVTNLPAGAYTFAVRATNGAGATTTAQRTFTIAPASTGDGDGTAANRTGTGTGADTSAPDTTINTGPKSKTTKKKAKFTFSSTEAGSSFECKLDKGGFEACQSPAKFKVKPGKHKLQVRAIDAAGNADTSPATYSWKVKKPS